MPRQAAIKTTCTTTGCDRLGIKRGMCNKHYLQWWYHSDEVFKITGEKRNHKYYHLWWDRKDNGCLSGEWLDFERFISDLGERPGKNYCLVRLDGTKPFGPDNFLWQPNLTKGPGESRKDWWARKWAARQSQNPGIERKRDLMRQYGITSERYLGMVAAQSGNCAICKSPETAIDNKTGTLKRLAVDHCHTTGKIRGLLCFRCNSVIGRIEENVEILDAMRGYLVLHGT